ncbi:hypothetical protein QTH47_13425 [Clostridium perfringens]|nr:hypothetical protein [Clostridium perfringens]
MSGIENFRQNDMYSKSRTDIYNPNFKSNVSAKSNKQQGTFEKNLDKWCDFMVWAKWFPDLFLDLITPEEGGIRLDLDQRVFLRCMIRFVSIYGTFPRGYGKTFVELLAMYITAVLFPDITLSMSAQTREASAKLFNEKHREILKFYPLLKNEIVQANISKDTVEITFASGAVITNLANAQSSKGLRRHRLNIEEAALLNDELFQDALEPIPNIPRRTIGSSLINPEEMNGQMHFLTTAYFKNTEYERSLRMLDDMADLKGKIVIGSDWQLACEYGRGETKTQILAKKERLSPIFFATNYESRWVGSNENCIVDVNKLLELRVLPKAELKGDGKSEYYMAVDVARSAKTSNNQTSIVIGKVKRDKNERVRNVKLVNMINLPNGMNFTGQAIAVKRLRKAFNAIMIAIDINGLGIGLLDELMKVHIDPITGEELEAYDTINTDHESDEADARKCVFGVNAQGINTDVIVNFMNMVESGKLQLLDKVDQAKVDLSNQDYMMNSFLPSIQTDFFIEEVANLSLKTLNGGKLTVERNTKTMDKDRYSAVAYLLYYIKTYEDKPKQEESEIKAEDLFFFKTQKFGR